MQHATAIPTSTKAALPENIDRLRSILVSFGENISRLEQSADNLGGSHPSDPKPAQPRAVPSGHVGAFIDVLEDAASLSTRLANLADRFCNLV